MTFHYPRRVKDLPKLELDSDDENINLSHKKTNDGADKSKSLDNNSDNKENSFATSTRTTNSYANAAMYPKRRSELPALESDSDSDDNPKENKLNCAILNDSFLLSPCKTENDYHSNTTESTENKNAVAENDDNLSFLSNFHKMALCSAKKEPMPHGSEQSSTSTSQALPKLETKTIGSALRGQHKIEEKHLPTSAARGTLQRTQSEPATKPNDIDTPLRPITSNVKPLNSTTNNSESQFATPQIRSFSVQRRPRDLCVSSQSQKTRSAIVNEFRSQKVLFQTPMAITRAVIPNDSLTISLCDTIPECADTPSSTEKTPRRSFSKEQKAGKSKKSLEGAFNEAEDADHVKTVDEADKADGSANLKSQNSERIDNTTTPAAHGKETMLHINNSDYAIIKKLGAGGSSSVYLARRKDNGKECALKVVDLQGDPAVVEGYLNETKLLAKLQGNVCVVSLYEYQLLQKESKLFLVMEKGDSDLHKILQTYTTNLPLYVLMNFLYQMLQAVNYIHQNGVIHSDLKPANFLMVNGRLKLIDFGIASNIAIDSTSIIKFSQAGTFNYISPEALTDTSTGSSPMRSNQPKIKISTKSDVWSLGCILYLLLYKKTPFSHIKNIYAKITAISSPTHAIEYPTIPPYYPEMLVHMVKNCLQHNPKQRPSCADLLKYPFHMVIPIQNLSVSTK